MIINVLISTYKKLAIKFDNDLKYMHLLYMKMAFHTVYTFSAIMELTPQKVEDLS